MSQKVCPQCQTVNEATAQFCGGCGNRMAEPQVPQYQAPQQPQYQAPQYQAPQYSAPQAPQYQPPQTPQYPPQVPQYQVPHQPQYQQPAQYPAPGAMPQAPYMGAPQQAVYQSFGAPAGMLLPAGFGIRFLAFLIDTLIFSIPGWFIDLGYLLNALQIAYYIGMWGARGQTLGQMLLGLRVVTIDGQPISYGKAALRWAGYLVSALTLGIGFLMIAFDSQQHRGLHDRIAGTLVVKKA